MTPSPPELEQAQPAPRRRTAVVVHTALLLGGLALLGWLVHVTGPDELATQLRRVGLGAALLFLVPTPLAFAVETLAWRLAFRDRPPVALPRLYLLYAVGENLNGLLPGVSVGGEPYKVLMLRRWGVPVPVGLASVLVARTSMTLALAAFIALGLAAALATAGAAELGGVAGASALLALVAGGGIACLYLLQRRGLGPLLARLVGWSAPGRRWLARHGPALARLDDALAHVYVRRPARLWLMVGLAFAGWTIEALEVAVFAWALGIPLGPLEIYAIGALAMAATAIGAFVPASAGVQEGGIVLVGLGFGLDESAALAFGLLRRGRQLFFTALGLVPMALFGLGRGPGATPLAGATS
ncbi:MAG: flippase-like domain-containing protein [Planctomycetes bacterium]|nr:flippase-like domain-containing protein [Planctomycetota bacterium]